MADAKPAPESAPAGSGAKRYLLIGVPLVVALALFLLVFWPRIQLKIAINGLHAHKPEQRLANLETIKEWSDKEQVTEMLTEAVEDDGLAFEVRLICAGLLLNHFDRVGALEKLLRTGSLSTRGAVLKTLSLKPYFENVYVDDQSFAVRDTVRRWMGEDGDLTRVHAVQLAVKLEMAELAPQIRGLLAGSGAPNAHASQERNLIIAAGGAMRAFKVCDVLPAMMQKAREHPDAIVRLRFMQFVDDMVFRLDRETACPGGVAAEDMKALVVGALDDADHTVRMGAMLILRRKAEWMGDASTVARLLEIVNGDHTGAERRHALEVLASTKDAGILESLPRFFHDPDPVLRSTAASLAEGAPDLRLGGCLIGLVGAESEDERLFVKTLQTLKRLSHKWVGFPRELAVKAAKDPPGFKSDLATLFSRGELGEITRDGLAEAWFSWWCDHLELTGDQKKEAVAVRRVFWRAMDARDEQAAEAALDGLSFDVPGLFDYERGWLSTRSG